MRLHGYCVDCRRIKPVSVSSHALVMAQARGGVVQGVCQQCEDKRREKK